MNETSEGVLWRQALGSLNAQPSPGEACPEPERFWEAAAGSLEPSTLRTLLDHTAHCPSCLEAWAMARELQGRLDEEAASSAPPSRRRTWSPWRGVVAAAAVLAIALGLRLVVPPDDTGPGYRGGGDEIVSLLSEDTLPRDRFELRWRGPEGTDVRYNLRLTRVGEEGLIIIADVRGLETERYRIPAGDLTAVPQGAVLTWRVEALRGVRPIAARSFVVTLQEGG